MTLYLCSLHSGGLEFPFAWPSFYHLGVNACVAQLSIGLKTFVSFGVGLVISLSVSRPINKGSNPLVGHYGQLGKHCTRLLPVSLSSSAILRSCVPSKCLLLLLATSLLPETPSQITCFSLPLNPSSKSIFFFFCNLWDKSQSVCYWNEAYCTCM